MLKFSRLVVALAICACSLPQVFASTVQYTYSANVFLEIRGNQLATADQTFFSPGALVAGSFDFDSAAPAIPAGPNGTVYESIFNLTGSVDGNSFSDPGGGVVVINDGFDFNPGDPAEPLTDLLVIGAEGGPEVNLAGFSIGNGGSLFTLVNVRLFWINPNGGFIDDESLPSELAPNTEIARLALDFVDVNNGNNTHTVFAEPLSLNASPVPLPAAAWLFLGAMSLLGVTRKQ